MFASFAAFCWLSDCTSLCFRCNLLENQTKQSSSSSSSLYAHLLQGTLQFQFINTLGSYETWQIYTDFMSSTCFLYELTPTSPRKYERYKYQRLLSFFDSMTRPFLSFLSNPFLLDADDHHHPHLDQQKSLHQLLGPHAMSRWLGAYWFPVVSIPLSFFVAKFPEEPSALLMAKVFPAWS